MEALKAPTTWEGALALAQAIDGMVLNPISRERFVRSLNEIGIDGELVLKGLLATGLVVATEETIALTREGRLVVIHATSVL